MRPKIIYSFVLDQFIFCLISLASYCAASSVKISFAYSFKVQTVKALAFKRFSVFCKRSNLVDATVHEDCMYEDI